MGYTISKALASDAEELSWLVNSAYRGDSSKQGWTTEADLLDGTRTTPELIDALLKSHETFILKYVEDQAIRGCVDLKRTATKLYLGMLTVKPSLQGKGIGKILLNEAESEARKLDCRVIYMTVISVRKELIDWYKRHGYSETGERKPFELPDERWGIPKTNLEFMVLEKVIAG